MEKVRTVILSDLIRIWVFRFGRIPIQIFGIELDLVPKLRKNGYETIKLFDLIAEVFTFILVYLAPGNYFFSQKIPFFYTRSQRDLSNHRST